MVTQPLISTRKIGVHYLRKFRLCSGFLSLNSSRFNSFKYALCAPFRQYSNSATIPIAMKTSMQRSQRNFAILQTGHASPYATETYGGYGQMFIDLLGEPGENWEVFSIIDGNFPSEKDLNKFEGFVITGSSHDAHGSDPWIEPLCDILRELHAKKRKLLGVCFGHQVLSRALGGKTGRSTVGWTLGLKEIPLSKALLEKPYGKLLPDTIRALGVHQDQVSEIPPGAELLASTERTRVEMFCIQSHVLAIQSHPEFTKDVVADLINKRLVNGIINHETAEIALTSMEKAEVDRKALQLMCKTFLKSI